MEWFDAPDIQVRINKILKVLGLPHILSDRLIVYKSYGSTGRAIARIWSLPRVWQQALKIEAHYIIEVISERFDRLSVNDQDRTLIHELMHIPKSFSGALVSHRGRSHQISHKTVEILYQKYLENSK